MFNCLYMFHYPTPNFLIHLTSQERARVELALAHFCTLNKSNALLYLAFNYANLSQTLQQTYVTPDDARHHTNTQIKLVRNYLASYPNRNKLESMSNYFFNKGDCDIWDCKNCLRFSFIESTLRFISHQSRKLGEFFKWMVFMMPPLQVALGWFNSTIDHDVAT